MRLDQGLPGRCDQTCEWLAGPACAPRGYLVTSQSCCNAAGSRETSGGGKAGVIRLVGFASRNDWVRVHHETVRTVPRYRQLTPAAPATLLIPTSSLLPAPPGDPGLDKATCPCPFLIDNDNGHRGAADCLRYLLRTGIKRALLISFHRLLRWTSRSSPYCLLPGYSRSAFRLPSSFVLGHSTDNDNSRS